MVDTLTAARGNLGTVSVLAWIGDPDDGHDTPYLLAYTLGDGAAGAAGSEQAMAVLAEQLSLPVDGTMTNGARAGFPVKLFMVDRQATLNLQTVTAQCQVPEEWLAAVDAGASVHLMVSTTAWPQAVPGQPVSAEMLAGYIGDEKVFAAAAHCVVPVARFGN
ncbi:DUF5949 family protein [Streptomyces sp. KLOTTS4A1]|uniref:DUF5949 family protein n=1 Tax=Streptomyces sp. KLOTTS4A1 TaxID=3390996 RepID=UPI0039F4C788